MKRIALAILSVLLFVSFAQSETYVFRYKPGIFSASVSNPETPADDDIDPNDYDVVASFISVVGEESEHVIPLKPGKSVANWSRISGALPNGLSLDASSGRISGSPTGRGTTTMKLVGISADGADVTKALVDYTVLEGLPSEKKLDLYAHSDRYFQEQIAQPGEAYSWVPVKPLPSWAFTDGLNISGTPPIGAEGVYSFAYQGIDFLGNEVRLAYGTLTVEAGPNVAHVEDKIIPTGQLFALSTEVARSVGDIVWSLEGDPLPANLGFNQVTGVIRGIVPTFSTSATLRFVARDSDGTVGRSNYFTLKSSDPVLDIRSIPDRTFVVGEYASMTISAQDVTGPATWSVSSGVLPDGLSIDPASGTISGTPSKVQSAENITVSVETTWDTVTSNPFSIIIVPEAVVASAERTSVRVDTPFVTSEPTVSGGTAPYTFAVAEGGELPAGVSLDPHSGTLSGTLNTAVSTSATLIAMDADDVRSQPFQVGIDVYNPLTVTMPAVVEATRLQPMDAAAAQAGEKSVIPSPSAPFGTFSIVGTLPAGIQFNASSGTLYGTPQIAGAYGPFVVSLTDASGTTASSNPFSITVAEKEPLSVRVVNDTVHSHSSIAVAVAEAISPAGAVTWSSEGTLPEGLTLRPDGLLVGVAQSEGTYTNIVLHARDEDGATASTEPFSLTVAPPAPIAINPPTFRWSTGRAFSKQLEASNAVGQAAFSLSGGSLPAGVSMSETGVLSGTVSSAGTTEISVTVTDSLGRSTTSQISLIFTPPMTISLPGSNNVARMSDVTVVPEVANVIGSPSFAISGSLPNGLEFNPTSGEIFGNPTAEGSYGNLRVTVTDATGATASATTAFTVGPREALSISYSLGTLTLNSREGLPKLPITQNAIGTVSYSLEGELPPGLAFSTSNGAITGTPTRVGTYGGLNVTAVDSEGVSATTGPFTLTVAPSGSFTVNSYIATGRSGVAFASAAPEVRNAIGTVTYSTKGSLPFGLTLIPSTGSLVGTPSTTGSGVANLTATDEAGRTVDFIVTVKVVGPLSVAYTSQTVPQYSESVIKPTTTNQIGSVAYAVEVGTLPSGMTLDPATGEIRGTPDTKGSHSIRIRATDEGTASNTALSTSFTVSVGNRLPLALTVPDQDIIVNLPYEMTLSPTNAVGAVTWSMTGTLPSGVSFESTTGTISGTPDALGTSSASFTVTDSVGGTATSTVNFRVATNGLPISLTTYNIQTKPGRPFVSTPPLVRNSVGNISFYTDDLNQLGVTLDPVTGVISGQYNDVTKVTGNIHVTDSTNRVTSKPITVDVIPFLKVNVRERVDVTASTSMGSLAPTVEYAIGTVTYELIGPALPTGLSFNTTTGAIAGTPSQLGTFGEYHIAATDSIGDRQTSSGFTIVVHASGILPTVRVTPSTSYTANVAINLVPTVSPKKTGDVYRLNKPLPGGLSIDPATGTISGVPGESGAGFHPGYILEVEDTAGNVALSNTFDLKIRSSYPAGFRTAEVRVRANQPFESEPPTYDDRAVFGELRYTTSSNLSGLVFDPATGVVSGKVPSSRTVTVAPVDSIGGHSTFPITITVVTPTVTIPSTTVDAGTEISLTPVIKDFVGTVRFAWDSGSEVEGLEVDPTTGTISGTMPYGSFTNRRIAVTDDYGTVLSYNFTLGGRNPAPSMSFEPWNNLQAEPNNYYMTDPVEVAGLYASTTAEISGSNYSFRLCATADCMNGGAEVPWNGSYTSARSFTVNPGQYLQLQRYVTGHNTNNNVTIKINNTTYVWQLQTRPLDTVPDQFDFSIYNNLSAELVTSVETQPVQITGILDRAQGKFEGSNAYHFRVCNQPDCSDKTWTYVYRSAATVNIDPGQYVQLRIDTASTTNKTETATLTISNVKSTFTVKTREADMTPDPFDLSRFDRYNVEMNEWVVTEPVQIEGLLDTASGTIYRSGGIQRYYSQYKICNLSDCSDITSWWDSGQYSTTDITVKPGQYIQLRMMRTQHSEQGAMRVVIGGVESTFSMSVRAADRTPDQFDLSRFDRNNIERSEWVQTEPVQITGLLDDASVTIYRHGGTYNYYSQYKICNLADCSDIAGWRDSDQYGTTNIMVKPGQYIQLRMMRSNYSETGTMRVVIGGVESTFAISVRAIDATPDPFDISQYSVTGAVNGQRYETPIIPITGILDPATFTLMNGGSSEHSWYRVCDNSDCSDFPNLISNSNWKHDITVRPGQYLQVAITGYSSARSLRIIGSGIDTVMTVSP